MGGRFVPESGDDLTLFRVEAGAQLGLRDSVLGGWTQGLEALQLLDNRGDALLNRVRIELTVSSPLCLRVGCFPVETPLLSNASGAKLELRNVVVADVEESFLQVPSTDEILYNAGTASLVRSQFYLASLRDAAPVANDGVMDLVNSTFLMRNLSNVSRVPLMRPDRSGSASAVNTVLDGFTDAGCNSISTEGFNSADAADCSWSAPTDQVGVRTGLIWRTSASSPEAPQLVPSAASPLVDSGSDLRCAALTDAGPQLLDGNGDGIAACDRGAVELSPGGLAEGGANGLFFNPDADGHYIYLLESGTTTLVMWNTFDVNGQQAWIYGTGDLINGRALLAEAYVNSAGDTPDPENPLSAITAVYWGEITVELFNCDEGLVQYESDAAGFGNGQFPIKRLVRVKQLGCIDP